MAVVMAPMAMVVVTANAEADVNRTDVSADDIGVGGRRAEQAYGEQSGDQRFHREDSGFTPEPWPRAGQRNGRQRFMFHGRQAAFASRANSLSTRSAAPRRWAGVSHSPLTTTF
jgi:hypothetical protein